MATNEDLTHLLGRVKWFNNKVSYGFITITEGSRSGTDIFVHHTGINVDNQQYKYLVQGEYVEFDLVKTESKTHEWQASNVVGVKGGKLMCETRRDVKLARNQYHSLKDTTEVKLPRQKVTDTERKDRPERPRQERTERPERPRQERPRQERPRQERTERPDKKTPSEWTLIKGGNNKPK